MKNTRICFLLFCACSWAAVAVGQQRSFRFGFSASAEFQTLNVGAQPARPETPVVSTEQHTGSGAGLGVWAKWQFLPVLHLRPGLQFSYTSNTIRFVHPDGQTRRDRYGFTDLEIPLHLILSDELRRLPLRALILFGGRVSWNLNASDAQTALRLLPERAGFDLGIGAGFRWGDWNVQPELIYSYGLNNAHDFRNTPYDWAVGRVLRDRLSLRLVFGPF